MDDPTGSPYAQLQLARAMRAALEAQDAKASELAQTRVARWRAVLRGLVQGSLHVGSRTPVAGWPSWVTLEVATGGFATGAALAGGAPLKHEHVLARENGLPHDIPRDALRHALNSWCLCEEGQAWLGGLLTSGNYAIDVPEEGAWLVVAWLLANGHGESALELIDTLEPFFSRLRFYPRPTVQAARQPGTVCLEDAGTTAAVLRDVKAPLEIERQRESLTVWTPLYDRIVALFLETVDGEPPTARRNASGGWERGPDNRFVIDGGWPCARWPQGWHDRAQALIAESDRALTEHAGCKRPRDTGTSLGQLLEHLRVCALDPRKLDGRSVGRIRLVLARYVATRGAPDSSACRAARQRERVRAMAPTRRELAHCVAQRLDAWPPMRGLDEPSALSGPVDATEAARFELPPGAQVPPAIRRRLMRCHAGTPEALVAHGLITSGEVLANLLPQITADLRASDLADESLQTLYAAILRAFARRRSLLLLDLQSQVRASELPWVASILELPSKASLSHGQQRQTLERISLLALESFPQAILPNKLLRELDGLARSAGLTLDFTEEIAADIFMGTFTPKFARAAAAAGRFLRGTLYARYYGLDDATASAIDAALAQGERAGRDFAELCRLRADAGSRPGRGSHVAGNGTVIEQQQVLTTHNLAVLAAGLDLAPRIGRQGATLARRCFGWVLDVLQAPPASQHTALIRLKNAAYAWRQMIFFMSLDSEPERTAFLTWAEDELRRRPSPLRDRFSPALARLAAVERAPGGAAQALPGRVFLGWTTERHWLHEATGA